MPYVITTYDLADFRNYDFDGPADRAIIEADAPQTRRAVDTLDEAIQAASEELWKNGAEPDSWRLDGLASDGAVIGPLPDGTVIDVAEADYVQLRARIGMPFGDETEQQILDAFNAAKG